MAEPKRDKGGHFMPSKATEAKEIVQQRSAGGQFVPKKVTAKRRAVETELSLLVRKHNGIITAEHVLAQAEREDSALHDQFDWDDSVAGHKYRLIQARQLITAVRITTEDRTVEVRALTSLDIDRAKGGGYRFLEDVMASPALREHLLQTALRELQSVESRYQHLTEFSEIWGAIEEASERASNDGKTLDSDKSE